ncbi:hypothetical protein A2165_01650 [Candidatus Curtissbacteria bacterium RBG_13_40_7]|uniref:Uncharacterized protein n=1 Tax=Candidatus Curtissbacteria bacterium RBG_13_40_7 TaxID=1797706 RepID=A0A1F5FXA9_9BACT|nr:MAG: hypothetical protein A2165_01650 [Candidatus Curtissbacteria bacterium RBG_13_40_7]
MLIKAVRLILIIIFAVFLAIGTSYASYTINPFKLVDADVIFYFLLIPIWVILYFSILWVLHSKNKLNKFIWVFFFIILCYLVWAFWDFFYDFVKYPILGILSD